MTDLTNTVFTTAEFMCDPVPRWNSEYGWEEWQRAQHRAAAAELKLASMMLNLDVAYAARNKAEERLLQAEQRVAELEAALADKPCPEYVRAGDPTAFAWMRQCKAAEKRVAELEAVVAKLPMTADGVPVVPGMRVYYGRPNEVCDVMAVSEDGTIYLDIADCDDRSVVVSRCNARLAYSTQAAAEAARKESQP